MQIGGHDVLALTKKTVNETLDDNLLGLAAETAYNFFFGLFPLFLFAAPLISLFGNREQIFEALLRRLAQNVPPDALALLRQVLHDVVFTKNAPGLVSIGAILALWAGAGMFSSLMSALNVAYTVKETRPWWKQKLMAIACTFASIAVLGSSTFVMLAGQQIVNFGANILHLSQVAEIVWAVLQYVLAFGLIVLLIWMLYIVLPNLDVRPSQTLPGAIFAAAFWVLFTYAFRLYVTNFGSYNKTYGAIGAVIVLLTWMYWTMFAVLVGGEFNSELHAETGKVTSSGNASTSRRIATHDGLPNPSSQSQ